MQSQKSQPQTLHPQQLSLASIAGQSQHGNIILVRGARTENGQIILQNSHELLNLFSDDDKPVILQSPRLKAKTSNEGTILLQSALKGAHIIDASSAASLNSGNAVLLQSSLKKGTTLPEGSIIVQQRLNKNGSSDGPILLQTLKRFDKSPSILVIRNPNAMATSSAAATVTTKATMGQRTVVTLTKEEPDDKTDIATTIINSAKVVSANVPLGSGEYKIYLLFIVDSYVFNDTRPLTAGGPFSS